MSVYDDPSKHPSTYVRFGGYIPKTNQNIPALKIGSNIYDLDQNKEYYKQSTSTLYYNNLNYESNSIRNSLNFKDNNISSNKIDYVTPSLDELIKNRHKQRSQVNNLTFLSNIKMNKNNSESTMKNSYTYNSEINVTNEIPYLYRQKKRRTKLFNDNTEYNQTINVLNPFHDKKLVIVDEEGLKTLNKIEQINLIKKSFDFEEKQKLIDNNNEDKKNFVPALRYEYDNPNISTGTYKSVNLSSYSTVHVPSSKLNNENNSYLKNSTILNSKSKQKDFFLKNSKVLHGDNYLIRIPGYSGHVPSNNNYLRERERIYCLSLEKGSNI
jgi:hypothetical protein